MQVADHYMPAGILAHRGCICGTPDDFVGLDSLANHILAFEQHYNAAATPFGWNSPGPISTSYLPGSPGTTPATPQPLPAR
jgi:hypothetical protein